MRREAVGCGVGVVRGLERISGCGRDVQMDS